MAQSSSLSRTSKTMTHIGRMIYFDKLIVHRIGPLRNYLYVQALFMRLSVVSDEYESGFAGIVIASHTRGVSLKKRKESN